MPERFALSLAALDILGERLGVEVRLFPFEIPHVARTLEDRARIAGSVLRDLQSRDLARRGQPEPDVVDALAMLARAPALGMVQALRTGDRVAARVASNGRAAVLAVARGTMVELELLRPTAVVAALLGSVPSATPMVGRSVTFPVEEPPGRHAEDDAGGGVLQAVRPTLTGHAAQREIARQMMALPCRAGGLVIGFGRDRHGREQRGEPFLWRDTDTGRFTSHAAPSSDGQVWCSYTPADSQRLIQQVSQVWAAIA